MTELAEVEYTFFEGDGALRSVLGYVPVGIVSGTCIDVAESDDPLETAIDIISLSVRILIWHTAAAMV